MSTIVRIRNVLFISVFPVYYSYESQAANTIAVNESAERDALTVMTVVAFVLFLSLAVALSLVESKDVVDSSQAQPGVVSTGSVPNSTGITPSLDHPTGNTGNPDHPTGTTNTKPDHPIGDN